MKAREILKERVSLSTVTPTINSALSNAIMQVFNTPPKTPVSAMNVKFMIEYNTILVNAIKPILTHYARDLTDTDVNIQFKSLPQGTGQYLEDSNTITITPKILATLIKLLFSHYTNKINMSDVNATINQLTSIFLHEVTHAKQVSQGQRYEYKHGYIEHDKIKFFTALIQDKFNSEEERQRASEIYRSQPDEIAAYSQEAATGLISKIHKLPHEEQIAAIDVFLRELPKQQNTYSDFKHRDDPRYEKVHRRYLKLMYQTLNDYKHNLTLQENDMRIDEIFSQRELDLMAPKPKKEKEKKPAEPPSWMSAREKRKWREEQKAKADRAAFRQFEKEKKEKELAAQNTPEERAKRKKAEIDADLAKINSAGRTKATDPARNDKAKKPAKKTYDEKDVDYMTKFAHKTDKTIPTK